MEYGKHAMYQRAGRSRGGWVQAADRPRQEAPVTSEPPANVMDLAAMPAEIPDMAMLDRTVPETAMSDMTVPIRTEPEVRVEMFTELPAPPRVAMPAEDDRDCATPVMAQISGQRWRDIYDADVGLSRGTIFAQIDLPFVGEGACRHE